MELGDDALLLDKLEEYFLEDAEEEEVQHDRFLLSKKDEDYDTKATQFKCLSADFDEQFKEDPEEIILLADEILPASSSDEES